MVKVLVFQIRHFGVLDLEALEFPELSFERAFQKLVTIPDYMLFELLEFFPLSNVLLLELLVMILAATASSQQERFLYSLNFTIFMYILIIFQKVYIWF